MKKIFLLVLAIILISGCASNPYQMNFAGNDIVFRANLLKAREIRVYPDEQALKQLLLSPDIEKIKIAFVSNDEENGFFAVASYELGFKLTKAYTFYYQKNPVFESTPINSTAELKPSKTEPILFLLGPKTGANQTAVTVKDNLVVLEGKDFSEINRRYTDLDLAVDKLLLAIMS